MKNYRIFNSPEELKEAFDIDNSPEYRGYKPISGLKAGFIIKREYPPGIRYKPPKKSDGTPDTVMLIRVCYVHPSEPNNSGQPYGGPLIIKIMPYGTYVPTSPGLEYDFTDQNCPTKESLAISKATPQPVDLNLCVECYYDPKIKKFIHAKAKPISGKEILNHVIKKHLKTVHPLKGFPLKVKNALKKFFMLLVKSLIRILKWILKYPLGRTLESKDSMVGWVKKYAPENLKRVDTETCEFQGVKAQKNIVITFSAIVLVVFLVIKVGGLDIPLLKEIASNIILSVCACVIGLSVLEFLLPKLILWIVNALIKFNLHLIFKGFKV